MIVPRHKNKEWFWGLGEVMVDCGHLPHDALCSRDEGATPRFPREISARVIIFDALGGDQEGLGETDFRKSHVDPPPQDHRNRPGRRSTPWSKRFWEFSRETKSHAPPCVASPRRPVGMSPRAWKVQRVSATARGLIPLPPDSILKSILPRSAVMSEEHDSRLDSIVPCSKVMSQENDSTTELRAQEQEPAPDRLVEGECIEQNQCNPLPSCDLPEVCEPPISKASFVHPRTKKVSLQDRISNWIKGLQNASPSELTCEESPTLSLKANDRRLPFSGIRGDPVTVFRTRDRSVRSVTEVDSEHPHCQDYRNWIYNRFKDTVFKEGGNHWSQIEKNMEKRGPNKICVSELIPEAKLKPDKPIPAVGLREEVMREKIKEVQKIHWVSRGFLVPKPGTKKWRLVVDYRYVNTQLHGCEFLLPVIEDLFVKQAGNQLWTLLDIQDRFHQMPLSECSRQYTAFCTPFGVFEWRVLPMGMKVGPQGFQRMVSDCLKSLQPHKHICIVDLLTGTRLKLCGKGKILDSKAYLKDHFQNVVRLFEKSEECHHKLRFEKCHLFMERIKYCGHVLHGGIRSPAPSKVDAVRVWPKPKTPKQMKGFLGAVNWYSIYVRRFPKLQPR